MGVDRHIRVRVYGPEEAQEGEDFYERKKGAAGMEPVNFTAFRSAERKYKRTPIDISDVIKLDEPNDEKVKFKCELSSLDGSGNSLKMYELRDYEGFCFIPQAFSVSEQKYWITRAFSIYMAHPNASNLNSHFVIPQEGLWPHYVANDSINISRIHHVDDSEKTRALPMEMKLEGSEEICSLIRKIRWVTLGYQYDWTTKTYKLDKEPVPFPSDLAEWCQKISKSAGFGDFVAEAGIVNFYQPGDTLTGHVDRSEPNMNVPLISMSLGADCIYLLGGKDRNDPVIPLLLRSGDVVFMSGPSRLYYHGVPRILDPSPLLVEDESDSPETRLALNLLSNARINVNIRQVN